MGRRPPVRVATTIARKTSNCGLDLNLSGTRVSDAMEWARAILDRYGNWEPGSPPTMLTDQP